MTEPEEDKLLALKDFMLKSNKAKAVVGEQGHQLGEGAQTGVIDLALLGITGRQVDLVKPKAEPDDKKGKPWCALYAHQGATWSSVALSPLRGGFRNRWQI